MFFFFGFICSKTMVKFRKGQLNKLLQVFKITIKLQAGEFDEGWS